MKKVVIFSVVSICGQCISAQSLMSVEKSFKPAIPSMEKVGSLDYSAESDLIFQCGKGFSVWNIRDAEWNEFSDLPQSIVSIARFQSIKGPRILKVGSVQEYQVAFVSSFKGVVKNVFAVDKITGSSVKVDTVHFDDDIEIKWIMRTSSGVRVISPLGLPKIPVRFAEPVVSYFKIELQSQGVQKVEIYINGYRNGKLVAYGLIPVLINRDGEATAENEKMNDSLRWTSDQIKLEKLRSDACHRLNGLYPGEYIDVSEDLSNQ